MKKLSKWDQTTQKIWIEGGYLHYRYDCDNEGNIVSITCLLCNTTSIDEEDIDQQYCKKCNRSR